CPIIFAFPVTFKYKSSIVLRFSILASLGHNDPGTPYTASGYIGLADSDPLCVDIYCDEEDEANIGKDEDDDDQDNDDDRGDKDERIDSDNDGDDFVHPKFSTHDEEDK
ncbi:hypothetical protein Tco_0062097, partial [Tanacetum coccineum]